MPGHTQILMPICTIPTSWLSRLPNQGLLVQIVALAKAGYNSVTRKGDSVHAAKAKYLQIGVGDSVHTAEAKSPS